MRTYKWLNDASLQFLEREYLRPGQSVEDRVAEICDCAERILGKPGWSAKFHDYFSRGFYSFSTPVWTNFGTNRGFGVSCFGATVQDSMFSILDTNKEIGLCSKYGGGTSLYLGNLRGRGATIKDNGKSSGAVHFAKLTEAVVSLVSQGSARRGSCAVSLPIDHPDIEEFLAIKSEGHPIQDLSFAVSIDDDWMEAMIGGDEEKRRIWARVLERRLSVGYPYIFFEDTVNRHAAQVYRDKGMLIKHSNLCHEICEAYAEDESFVCVLNSMNIAEFDEWRETDAVEVMIEFLDANTTDFIQRAGQVPGMEKPVRFAQRQRALGLGWLGFHTYLQRKGVAWESLQAKAINRQVGRLIRERSIAASQRLAAEYGEPELMRGYGLRNATLNAIAPTKSSSWIIGQVSEGIEPIRANIVVKDLQKGKFTWKNPELIAVLTRIGQNSPEVWRSILENGGSVQHLPFLSDHERDVFKTFGEISQLEVIRLAAGRQEFLDQSQSLNIMVDPTASIKDFNALHIEAFRTGIKTLYYCHSMSAASQFSRNMMSCTACEA